MLCTIDVCWVASNRTDTEFSIKEVDGGLVAKTGRLDTYAKTHC